jgi:hypothetical protein
MYQKFELVVSALASYLRGPGLETQPGEGILEQNVIVACNAHGEKCISN